MAQISKVVTLSTFDRVDNCFPPKHAQRKFDGLLWNAFQVRVRISPVGVHTARLRDVMQLPESVWRKGELEAKFAGKTLIVGVDDMDPFKGIDLKCQAMEALLRMHPELIGKIVLLQVRTYTLCGITGGFAECGKHDLQRYRNRASKK